MRRRSPTLTLKTIRTHKRLLIPRRYCSCTPSNLHIIHPGDISFSSLLNVASHSHSRRRLSATLARFHFFEVRVVVSASECKPFDSTRSGCSLWFYLCSPRYFCFWRQGTCRRDQNKMSEEKRCRKGLVSYCSFFSIRFDFR